MLAGYTPMILRSILWIMAFQRHKLLKQYGTFSSYKNREWITEFDISQEAFSFEKRKNGISLFARLKNSQDYLEESIESHIHIVDEIVLVDNNSDDRTQEICQKMRDKYPDKVKYYPYTPKVYVYGHEKWSEIPNDSVASMAYYYNWTLSKTTYKYVAKLDDDMVVFDDQLLKSRISQIKKHGSLQLEIFPQINISIRNNRLMIPMEWTSKILPLFGWLYLDHGIFPISEKTYFVRWATCEVFLFPFWFHIHPLSIFHLKWMKKNAGTTLYEWEVKKAAYNLMTRGEFIPLPTSLREKLSKYVRLWDLQ